MNQRIVIATIAMISLLIGSWVWSQGESLLRAEELPGQKELTSAEAQPERPAPSIAEAKMRARILHETVHGTLQVMHRDFFRKDQALKIPSRSLEDVFHEVEQNYGIEFRWLAVDTGAMSVDNEATSPLEKEVVKTLKAGEPEFEKVEQGTYHYAGRIQLSAVCLSCHASARKNNTPRSAALLISQPVLVSE